jgi:alanyl aminopeptidase
MAWLADRMAVDPDMVGVVLRTAAQEGDRALFEAFRAEAKKEKDERPREELLGAMGSFRDPEIVKVAMPIVLTDEFDNRESIDLLFGPSQWPKTRDMAYDFVKQNFDALVAKLPTDTGAFFPFIAGGYCDNEHRADVEAFFKGRSTKYTGGPRNLDQVLEGISLCVAHKNAQQASVVEFLEKY